MYSIQSICKLLEVRVPNANKVTISGLNSLQKACEGQISYLQDKKFEKYLYNSNASYVLVEESFVPKMEHKCTLLMVPDVMQAWIKLLDYFGSQDVFTMADDGSCHIADNVNVHESVLIGHFSVLSSGVEIGEGSKIATQVYLGENVKLGKNVRLYPGVKIYKDCILGDNCIVHANSVIGSDGFGFTKSKDNKNEKIPQTGNVIIGRDVEIGANVVIDRSTFGSTLIENGVKIDNLVQVAHNVEIGENTLIAAQTGISGSVTLGKSCIIGGQSAFVPHISVADGSQFQGKSGVSKSIKKAGGKYYGYPAIDFNQYIRSFSVFKDLPDLEKRLRKIEKELIRSKKE